VGLDLDRLEDDEAVLFDHLPAISSCLFSNPQKSAFLFFRVVSKSTFTWFVKLVFWSFRSFLIRKRI
jgi:hypothetical protein